MCSLALLLHPAFPMLPVMALTFDDAETAILCYMLDLNPNEPDVATSIGTRAQPERKWMSQGSRAKRLKPKCEIPNCNKRVQSRHRCKRHGGGSVCKRPRCSKSQQVDGLCHSHGGKTLCNVPGCTKARQKRGVCCAHGGRDECLAVGCTRRARVQGSCLRHRRSDPPNEMGN